MLRKVLRFITVCALGSGAVAACTDGTDYGHVNLGEPSGDAGSTTLSRFQTIHIFSVPGCR